MWLRSQAERGFWLLVSRGNYESLSELLVTITLRAPLGERGGLTGVVQLSCEGVVLFLLLYEVFGGIGLRGLALLCRMISFLLLLSSLACLVACPCILRVYSNASFCKRF